jgi:hypothetical protein
LAGELEAGGIQLSEGAGCRQRCRPLCGGAGVLQEMDVEEALAKLAK